MLAKKKYHKAICLTFPRVCYDLMKYQHRVSLGERLTLAHPPVWRVVTTNLNNQSALTGSKVGNTYSPTSLTAKKCNIKQPQIATTLYITSNIASFQFRSIS